MPVASNVHLLEPTEGSLSLPNAGLWTSHSVDDRSLQRHVRHRRGHISTSSVAKRSTSGDLAADFDLSWLTSASFPSFPRTEASIRVADLFAGCGAMSLGLQEACRALHIGFTPIFAAEMDPVKASVYERNFSPLEIQLGPIEHVLDGELGSASTPSERELRRRLGDIDVLLGGPPCQGHSDLNNHTRRNDQRNNLLTRMARFAELFRPQHIVVENVQGVRHDRGRAASTAANYLRQIGYYVEELLVDCSTLGVPQSRRRYMLVASLAAKSDLAEALRSATTSERSVGWALADLMEGGTGVYDTSAVHSAENERRMRYLFERDLYELPDSERPDCHKQKAHSYKSVYGRMHWAQPAPTITTGFGSTGQGRFVHPLFPRTLTPHEAARLQTIPDFFDFGEPGRTQLQKMIGNSVPPLAMAAVAMELLR